MKQTGQITALYKVTRDTLRFYIAKGLLTPNKVNGKYVWGTEDESDLEIVMQLRALGLSISAIQRIKMLHEQHCGTTTQWEENRALMQQEINLAHAEMAKLQQRVAILNDVLVQIEAKIATES